MSSAHQSQLPVSDFEHAQEKCSEENPRPPLVPSEKNNVVNRKPRTREITSRYKSPIISSTLATPTVPSSGRRYPSPNFNRTVPASTTVLRRAQSAERRRPSTPASPSRPSTPPNNSTLRRQPSTPSSPSRPSTPPNNSTRSNGLVERQSPNLNRTVPASTTFLRRAQSAERRRPSTPSSPSRPSTPPNNSTLRRQPPTPSSPSKPSTPPNNSTLSNGLVEKQFSSKSSRSQEGLWPSTRSICVSFQTDTFSLPVTKREKPAASDHTLKPSSNVARKQSDDPAFQRKVTTPERKRTPLRGNNADQLENSKPLENSHSRAVDRHMWPGRSSGKTSGNGLNRSVDVTDKASKATTLLLHGQGVSAPRRTPTSDILTRGFQRSNVARRVSFDGREVSEMGFADDTSLQGNSHFRADRHSEIPILSRDSELENTAGTPWEITSGTESFPFSSDLNLQEVIDTFQSGFTRGGSSRWRSVPGLRSSMPESEVSSAALVLPQRPKVISSSTGVSSSSSSERASSTPRSSRSQSSPLRGLHHPPSPSKSHVSSTSSRGMISPYRPRWTSAPSASSVTDSTRKSSSVLNFVADVRKGKKGASYIEEVHQLRILYNRHLQWRFINAQANASLSIQQVTVEKLLYDVWSTTSELRDSVADKRADLQQLRQNIKINSILKEQIPYLDDWAFLEREHSDSLLGAIEALEASILRLPVAGGAKVDTQTLRDAIYSAVGVMQAMGSSIYFLLSKVEGVNGLVSELAEVVAQEKALLDECGELLAATAALQVEESSLRTHLIQLKQDVQKSSQRWELQSQVGPQNFLTANNTNNNNYHIFQSIFIGRDNRLAQESR